MAGTYINMDKFSLGAGYGRKLSYRYSAIRAMAGLNFNSFRIGYTIEKPINSFSLSNTYSNHEIYLIATISDKKDRSKNKPANVPIF